jgi:hypothetical protein
MLMVLKVLIVVDQLLHPVTAPASKQLLATQWYGAQLVNSTILIRKAQDIKKELTLVLVAQESALVLPLKTRPKLLLA